MDLYKSNFGLLPTEPDARDYTAKVFGIEPSQIGETFELELPDFVYDQERTDMCTAFASSMMLSILNKTNVKFSRCDIYAQKSGSGEGASLREILKVLRYRGACVDMLYDHKGTIDECREKYEQNKEKADYLAELGRIRHYYKAETEEDVLSALKLGKPLFAGIPVYDNFIPVDGVIPLPKGNYRGGHAILIVGHKPGYVKILNSWGSDWGIEGCAWVPYSMVIDAYVPVDASLKAETVYFQIGKDYYHKLGKKHYMTGIDAEGNEVPVSPFIKDGRTYIPLRYAGESVDVEVTWYAANQSIGLAK